MVQRAEGAGQENIDCDTKTGPGFGQMLPVWGSLGLLWNRIQQLSSGHKGLYSELERKLSLL